MNLSIIASSTCFVILLVLSFSTSLADSVATMPPPEPYCQWQVDNYVIKKPLCGFVGDAKRGKAIASDGSKGNCLACHQLPINGIEAYGDIYGEELHQDFLIMGRQVPGIGDEGIAIVNAEDYQIEEGGTYIAIDVIPEKWVGHESWGYKIHVVFDLDMGV